MIKTCFYLLFLVSLCTACTKKKCRVGSSKKQRFGMVTGIKPEKMAYYKELHAKPWPKVLKKIKECHIENYSIFIQKINEQYFLFSYFDYTGTDFSKDMAKMAADSVTQAWWKQTDPCQLPLPEAVKNKQTWQKMAEVFHLE